MSIGINATSAGKAVSADSNELIMLPVKVADTISKSSHGILFSHMLKTPVFKYGLSFGVIAAIFSISSVASSSMTSIASSTVTIPTSLPSLSTTGSASTSYFENVCATISLSS